MKRILTVAAVFVCLFQTIAYCQAGNDVAGNAVSKLKTLLTDHIIEKAYLHFDKPYYAAGDTVYFKAYVTMGERHEVSTISGILHVDLLGKNDVLMQSINLQLTNGTCYGDFALPFNLQKGNYRIRAYTQWMRNDGQGYFFDHFISVGSLSGIAKNSSTANAAPPVLQFFPEGGNLVNNVKSRLAFKAMGPDGLGVGVKGVVIDNDKTEIVKFASSHLGMGTFEMIPEDGKTYKAKLTFADGSQSTVDLPAIAPKGIVLAVNINDPDKISIEIRANRNYYKENLNKDLSLVIYSGGAVRTVKTKLDNAVLGVDLPKSSFHTGILQVTLFSETGEPLSERLTFIQNQDLLNLSVNADNTAYKAAEKVHISLNAKTSDNQPSAGSFSVAVIDENKVPADENTETTILSDILLTSDLKGYVEQPNYYFATVTSQTRSDLDVLMLTQGYRRFVWKQLLNDNPVAIAYQPEKYFDIAGNFKTKNGEPLVGKRVELLSVDGGPVLKQVTDALGNFNFPNLVYLDDTKFILKTETDKGRNQAQLNLKKAEPDPLIAGRDSADSKYNEKADMLAYLSGNQKEGGELAVNGSGKSIMLKNVIVNESKTYKSSNLGGSGHADQVINGEDIKNGSTLAQALNGVARGVTFVGDVPVLANSGGTSFGAGTVDAHTGTTMSSGISQASMLVVVDGVSMQAGSGINNINPGSVATVEILKGANASIYGMEGGQGVIVITTKQMGSNDIVSTEMSPGIFSIVPKGFYKAREFYSPQYENIKDASQRSDQRTTIFWKPNLVTDAFGNAAFSFFNGIGKGNYRVVIEGIDGKGNLGRYSYKYKVE